MGARSGQAAHAVGAPPRERPMERPPWAPDGTPPVGARWNAPAGVIVGAPPRGRPMEHPPVGARWNTPPVGARSGQAAHAVGAPPRGRPMERPRGRPEEGAKVAGGKVKQVQRRGSKGAKREAKSQRQGHGTSFDSRFSVLSSRFSVLSSRFSVLSSQFSFSVLSSHTREYYDRR